MCVVPLPANVAREVPAHLCGTVDIVCDAPGTAGVGGLLFSILSERLKRNARVLEASLDVSIAPCDGADLAALGSGERAQKEPRLGFPLFQAARGRGMRARALELLVWFRGVRCGGFLARAPLRGA